MLEEQAFRLTYLNHTLLSYISAFGAHHKNRKIENADLEVCKDISHILSNAYNILDNKSDPTITSDIKGSDAYIENQVQPTHAIILLGNIRRFAKELYTEAVYMS